MSSAPSFGAPGGHIFDVVAQGLKKHVFTAMLAQHVASELRMHFSWLGGPPKKLGLADPPKSI